MRLARSLRTANELLNSTINAVSKAQESALAKSKETDLIDRAELLRKELLQLEIDLNGNDFIVDKMELTPPSIRSRINRVRWSSWSNTLEPTLTQEESIKIAETEYKDWINRFNQTNKKTQELALSFRSLEILLDAGHIELEWE